MEERVKLLLTDADGRHDGRDEDHLYDREWTAFHELWCFVLSRCLPYWSTTHSVSRFGFYLSGSLEDMR